MQWTRDKSLENAGYLGSNGGNLLVRKNRFGLEYHDLTGTVLPQLNLRRLGLRGVYLVNTDLVDSVASVNFGACDTLVISPDQQWFATGHSDGMIRIWDLMSGKEIKKIYGHKDKVTALAVSSDCRFLLSSSKDNTVEKWDCITGKSLASFDGHKNSVAISSNSPWLFVGVQGLNSSAHEYLGVRKWNYETGEYLLSFGKDKISSISVNVDDHCFLYNISGGTIEKWDCLTGKLLDSFGINQKMLSAIGVSSNGQWLVSADLFEGGKKWDGLTGELIHSFGGSRIRALAISTDGRRVLSSTQHGDNPYIQHWNGLTGELLFSLDGYTDQMTAMVVSADGRWLFSGSTDGTIKKWDCLTGECLICFNKHVSYVISIALSADGCWLFSSSEDGTIKKWDCLTGKCILSLNEENVEAIAVTTDGHWIFSSSWGMVKKWNGITGEFLISFDGQVDQVTTIAISADGRWLFSGNSHSDSQEGDDGEKFYYSDETVKKWDSLTGELVLYFNEQEEPVESMVISTDGRWLFSSSKDKTIKKWDVATGELILSFGVHIDEVSTYEDEMVTSLAVSADSQWLFSSSKDRTTKKWSIETGECIFSFNSHKSLIKTLAANNDSRWLFSSSDDNTIKKWDIEIGECVLTIDHSLYAGAKIQGIRGLTDVQRDSMIALGAIP
jgi:WD40 repeat protein